MRPIQSASRYADLHSWLGWLDFLQELDMARHVLVWAVLTLHSSDMWWLCVTVRG